MSTSTFGEGVFETDATNEASEEDFEAAEEKIELTEREIAIASGNDPDNPDAAKQIENADVDDDGEAPDDPDEEPAEDDGGEQEDSGEDAAEDESAVAWSQSDRRLAQQYGLTEDELTRLPNVEALHATIDVLERQGGKVDQEGEAGKSAPEDEQDSGSDLQAALEKLGKFELMNMEDFEGYEGSDKQLIEAVHSTQQAIKEIHGILAQSSTAMQSFEQQEIARQQQQVVEEFNSTLDEHPDIYGTTKNGKVSKAYQAARNEVRDQAQIIFRGYMNSDKEMPPLKQIFEQAIRAAHGNQTRKRAPTTAQSEAARKANLQKQSKMRRSPGSKAASSKRSPRPKSDDPGEIANHPDVVEMFNNFQIENGAV